MNWSALRTDKHISIWNMPRALWVISFTFLARYRIPHLFFQVPSILTDASSCLAYYDSDSRGAEAQAFKACYQSSPFFVQVSCKFVNDIILLMC
ncbi:hypothetical protein SERLA73DRAFT_184296 [Serpula lacrymans var. lacrymans S7.3]|uniref:Uncharacterized protein n=2 Tax=Serpula lacrymans var. lacrymans TaxID=341189 RepID=F8Q2Y7_SERL3|nr:uncharacterized protein SERLADRAFT_471912 [Serpula lacrymans var. lacrymans S7.9]EGN97548.1 hypothetical protein SERLA73DRAFT_184296 [Serpula lacrymans var. lacrymans S7.3]EGO23145.1 hypothetical protein SERLADRAFT_471912 [Serpula lacrymans var. lacrymans S7.9]